MAKLDIHNTFRYKDPVTKKATFFNPNTDYKGEELRIATEILRLPVKKEAGSSKEVQRPNAQGPTTSNVLSGASTK